MPDRIGPPLTNDRIGPPLTNDAHWNKFVRLLKMHCFDEAILSQLEEFRKAGKLLSGLELILQKRDEIHELWFDRDASIFFAGGNGGDSIAEALQKLVELEDSGG